MPRTVIQESPPKWPQHPRLIDLLGTELTGGRDRGQPRVVEEVLARTGLLRVVVLWDAWDGLAGVERLDVIYKAYERSLGVEYREKIALGIALTFPEAYDSGMIPFAVAPLLRKTDPVTREQCLAAMLEEGASELLAADRHRLRFATETEAEACRQRLILALPGSEEVWNVLDESRPTSSEE